MGGYLPRTLELTCCLLSEPRGGWVAWVMGACLYRPLHAETGFLCVPSHDLPHPQPPAWRWRNSAISWPSLGHLKCVFHFIKDGSRTSERFSHLPKVIEIRERWRGAPDSRILRETPIKNIYLFIYLFLAVLGLHCCVQAFSRFGEQGLLSSCDAQASYCSGFSCGAWNQ